MLRSDLRFVDIDRLPQAVRVTRAVGAEGRRQPRAIRRLRSVLTGLRLALVEGNLRRLQLADYMGPEGSAGRTDVLLGRIHLVEVLQPWGGTPGRACPAVRGPLPAEPK